MTVPGKVNLDDKMRALTGYWHPGIVAKIDDAYVKIAKVKGDFVWHAVAMAKGVPTRGCRLSNMESSRRRGKGPACVGSLKPLGDTPASRPCPRSTSAGTCRTFRCPVTSTGRSCWLPGRFSWG